MGIFKGSPKFVRTIADMGVGEEGYTVPWAIAFDNDMAPYINTGMIYDRVKKEPLEVKIKRTGSGKSDYEIDVTYVTNYKWTLSNTLFKGIFGVLQDDVVALYQPNEQQYHLRSVSGPLTIDAFLNSFPPLQPTEVNLEAELAEAIKREDFEYAATLRDQIKATQKS